MGVTFWVVAAALFVVAVKVTGWGWVALAVWVALFVLYMAWVTREIRRLDRAIAESGSDR